MKILFLTLGRIEGINERSIYADLMRKFRNEGHEVFIVSPVERRFHQKTNLKTSDGVHILRIKTLNIQKTNSIEKGISTLLIEDFFFAGIKKYFSSVKFDWILYSTPPITFTKVIQYIKHRDGAHSYLLLKDIFPQNAVDLNMIREGSILHRYFIKKEKQLYQVSDFIGCMSPANVDYVIRHNHEINPDRVEVNPNSIEPYSNLISADQKASVRAKWKIPTECAAFIYGGNLGKPQGIDFLLEVLDSNWDKKDRFFVIVGSGTEYSKVESRLKNSKNQNVRLISGLPKADYDQLVQACDVGLIFLDKRFTIPNFPSRLLSYLECKMPVIAATDKNTDLGIIIEENGFGFWCESGNLNEINNVFEKMVKNNRLIKEMGEAGYNFLIENYTIEISYQIIAKHF
jgi:glycosyltransferase involved in cell wall biosynthesis